MAFAVDSCPVVPIDAGTDRPPSTLLRSTMFSPTKGSVELDTDKTPKGETRPRRAYCSPDKLVEVPDDEVR
jgi:hypothetical protein